MVPSQTPARGTLGLLLFAARFADFLLKQQMYWRMSLLAELDSGASYRFCMNVDQKRCFFHLFLLTFLNS